VSWLFVQLRATSSVTSDTTGMALVQRILSAAESGRKFKVIVLIPAVP
jgi:hypothetical protein